MPESDEGMQPNRKWKRRGAIPGRQASRPTMPAFPTPNQEFMLTGRYAVCILLTMYMDVLCIGVRVVRPGHDGARVARPSAFAKASADKTPSSRFGGSPAVRGKDMRNELLGEAFQKATEACGRLRKVKIFSFVGFRT